jgi:hypothetical protein
MNAHSNIQHVDRYRLGPLRDVRRLDERTKRNDLAAAVADARPSAEAVAAAERRVATAREAVLAARAARDRLVATTARNLAAADRFIERRRQELAASLAEQLRAREAHAGRVGAIDAARVQLTISRAAKEVVERHFARWREARAKLVDRRED